MNECEVSIPVSFGYTGRILISLLNGRLTSKSILSEEHHIATLESLIELLRAAGYTVNKD